MMMIEGKWVKFMKVNMPGRKTGVWSVLTKTDICTLGEVRWFGAWRRYVFFPVPETIYDSDCLHDIADFMAEQMRQWRKK